jgi:AraC family transcriptional regulator
MSTNTHPTAPHWAWSDYRFASKQRPKRLTGQVKSVTNLISITLKGRPSVRRISNGVSREWEGKPGTVHFLPADQQKHVFLTDAQDAYEFHVFFIPQAHLEGFQEAEDLHGPDDLRELILHDDPILRSCMLQLACPAVCDRNTEVVGDAASRQLLRRLIELSGGAVPDWHSDTSHFDRNTIEVLAEFIESRLKIAPSLSETSRLVALSPSHFAMKFRNTTGLSLHRYVNARRILASMTLLRNPNTPVSLLSADLGFSSQSHFNRLFLQHTGMTPVKYRKQIQPTHG